MRDQRVDIVHWEPVRAYEPEIVPVTPEVTDRKAPWLQRFAFWLARKAGWNGHGTALTERISYRTLPLDVGRELFESVQLQMDALRGAHMEPKRVYVGSKNLLEATKQEPLPLGYDGLGFELHYHHRVFGVPVTMVPNLDGVIVVPEVRN